jgi:hypothetical protein
MVKILGPSGKWTDVKVCEEEYMRPCKIAIVKEKW